MKVRTVAVVATLLSALTWFVAPVAYSAGKKATPLTTTTTTTTIPGPVAAGQAVIDGKGFGHGVGLAQDGALWMGKNGKSAKQILALFFPGTSLAKRGGLVRVPISSVGTLTVVLPNGGKLGELAIPPGTQLKLTAANGVVSVVKVGSTPEEPSAESVPSAASARTKLRFISASAKGAIQFLPLIQSNPAPQSSNPSTSVPPVPAAGLVPAEPTSSLELVVPTSAPDPDPATSTVPPASEGDPSSSLASSTIAAPPTTIANPNELLTSQSVVLTAANGGVSVVGAKKYRGTLEFTAASSGIRVVNELDVEQYLRGMGEVLDPRWPSAALQSQAIVARTYALRLMATKGGVCPTQRCQVYLGAQAEYPAMDAAVVASAGKVVTYEGQLAATFYSASGGGTIADPSEIWGPSTPIPYLKAGTYPIDDPKPWRVEMSLVELGRRIGYPGVLYDAVVSQRGPSGRATVVDLIGSAGVRSLAGPRFDAALGLKSTNFTISVGRSSEPTGSLPSGPFGSTGKFSSSTELLFDGESAFENDLFADIPISVPGTLSSSPSTVGPSSSSAPPTSPSTAPSAVTSPVTTSVDASVELVTDVRAGADLSGREQSTIPPWAGWAALGGSAFGVLWLALRWALRPEVHRKR